MHAPKDDKHFKTALSVILWDTLRLGMQKGWNIWVVSFMMVLNYRDIALRLLRPGLSWKIFKRRLSTVLLLTKNKAKPRTAQFGIICHFGTIHDPVVY